MTCLKFGMLSGIGCRLSTKHLALTYKERLHNHSRFAAEEGL